MRKVWDFHGGIHPAENKAQSTHSPIQTAPMPTKLILSLSQHIGAPSETLVKKGDTVLKGQQIAEANGPMSVALHAPTSGTIVDISIGPISHPSGMEGVVITLEPDRKDQWITHEGYENHRKISTQEIIEKIRQSGIAGLGGAGFPTAIKVNTREHFNIDTLIINGTECEPYISADDMLMRERPGDVIKGIEVLAYLIKPKKIIIGIEDNKPEAVSAMQRILENRPYDDPKNLQIVSIPTDIIVFPTKYPSGGEKQLIQILTGIEIPSATIPAQQGIVCSNISTAYAIHKAINLGEPLISRITTLTGNALESPQNLEVLIGTPVNELLEYCGVDGNKNSRLIMGGPMMGYSLDRNDSPVIKTTNCIIAATEQELPTAPPAQACIRCGSCAEVCPVSLLPQQLFWFSQAKEYDKAEAHHLFDCIECGACSYVCPSNIPLVQYYRATKGDIRNNKQKHAKAEVSRDRFEFRQQRLEQEAAAKKARREARAQAAKKIQANKQSGNRKDNNDAISAALARAKAKKAAQQNTSKKTDANKQKPPDSRALIAIKMAAASANVKMKKAQATLERYNLEENVNVEKIQQLEMELIQATKNFEVAERQKQEALKAKKTEDPV